MKPVCTTQKGLLSFEYLALISPRRVKKIVDLPTQPTVNVRICSRQPTTATARTLYRYYEYMHRKSYKPAVGALQYQDLDHWLRSRLPLPINNTQNVETQDERLLYTFRSRSVSVRKFIIFSYADSQFVLKCSPFIWVSEFLCVWNLKGLIVSFSTMAEHTFLNITKPKQCKQYPKAETQLDFQTT